MQREGRCPPNPHKRGAQEHRVLGRSTYPSRISEGSVDTHIRGTSTSAETHFSVAKAATALGVGLAPVGVDRDRRLDPAALRTAIVSDRAAGLLPICVVANAGTTSTGAVDPLDAVSTVAADAGVWPAPAERAPRAVPVRGDRSLGSRRRCAGAWCRRFGDGSEATAGARA